MLLPPESWHPAIFFVYTFLVPELPEVETIRRQIAPQVIGQHIVAVLVTRQRAIRAHASADDFIACVLGRAITGVCRRGKALLLWLDSGDSLLVRLGMSGRLTVDAPDLPRAPHTHVVLTLANAQELRYCDPRTFGQLAVVNGQDPDRMIELGHYGVEPLDDAFTPAVLAQLLAGKKSSIQAVLMDQTRVTGIGKIYADEACFHAGISPLRAAATLTLEEVTRLHLAIRDVLTQSIEARGTSNRDGAYRDAAGNPGGFQHHLFVYQREHQPCRRCGTLIEYRPFQGRRIHFCPHCQQ